mmetsp:Transcript_13692/g.39045  ORF Transcript_13692/g.39045 Transcript_13692/m.39045 type:complete len:133 (-) Transcript_13692:84-482(-)
MSSVPVPLCNTEVHTTTLMLCGLPLQMTISDLSEAVDALGFLGGYDFLSMPLRRGGRANTSNISIGYGFVNFKNPADVPNFLEALASHPMEGSVPGRPVFAQPAKGQGFAKCMTMVRQSAKKGHRISAVLSV